MLNAGNEVGERIALNQHLARVVPRLAQVSAAANMRIGHHQAAVEQAQPIAVESDRQRISVRPIAVHIKRVLPRLAPGGLGEPVFAVHNRYGNLDAIRGLCVDAFAGV